MDDDFNTRDALAVMFSLAREANRLMAEKKLSNEGVENILDIMEDFDSVFDILKRETAWDDELQSGLIELALQMREQARKKKDFEMADKIRDELNRLGIEIQDSADGPKWKIKQ
jgi:cysteinyl-tRNA synthetase